MGVISRVNWNASKFWIFRIRNAIFKANTGIILVRLSLSLILFSLFSTNIKMFFEYTYEGTYLSVSPEKGFLTILSYRDLDGYHEYKCLNCFHSTLKKKQRINFFHFSVCYRYEFFYHFLAIIKIATIDIFFIKLNSN